MERRIPLILLLLFMTVCLPLAVSGQELSQRERIQLMLWADLDAYPESAATEKTAHPSDSVFDYPIRRLKELAPYLLTGMVYGWDFSYTPSDRVRGVSEYFECTEVHPLGDAAVGIIYKKPWIENNRLYVWIEFARTADMQNTLRYWESVIHPKVQGTGRGNISEGFDGIKTACREALKDAVRSYYRQQIKNKPKEIDGKILISGIPRLTMESGQYVVELDFFLVTGTILRYTQF